jgi:hypothetical protein
MTLQDLKLDIEEQSTRFYNLKTKKGKEKARDAIRDLEMEALTILDEQCSKYATFSIKGTVVHFTAGDEYVCVKTKEFGTIWIDPTSDELSKSWYASTCCVEYIEGREIIIEIDTEVNMDTLCLNIIPKRTYGGTINENQYLELCKEKNLAFFKYPAGMSGLFE